VRWYFTSGSPSPARPYCVDHLDSIVCRIVPDLPTGVAGVAISGQRTAVQLVEAVR